MLRIYGVRRFCALWRLGCSLHDAMVGRDDRHERDGRHVTPRRLRGTALGHKNETGSGLVFLFFSLSALAYSIVFEVFLFLLFA